MKMRPLGGKALFYLAAAVSDFFVPKERMSEHKIQSVDLGSMENGDDDDDGNSRNNGTAERLLDPSAPGSGKKLVIDLDPVPKFLKRLVESWAPEGMIVSFKLETDPSILIKKCRMALKRYRHHLVIGNLLQTRKYEVVFVDKDSTYWLRLPKNGADVGENRNGFAKQDTEIEELIVPEVVRRHGALIWDVVAATRASVSSLVD